MSFNYKCNSLPTSVSADDLCKQFGPVSGLTICRARSGFRLFDSDDTAERYLSQKLILKKVCRR